MSRIYVCHTYYHVLISILKEFQLPENEQGKAALLLSTMSSDFTGLIAPLKDSCIFQEVLFFDEKRDSFFPELSSLKKDKGNIVLNMLARIKFTRKFAELQTPFVPVDFRKYEDIYVFCDTDPIGLYLNQRKIKYHAVEDGLDTLRPYVQAKYDNKGFFGIKKFMSMKMNLIFMCDGYSKYCIDMEVNDKSCIKDEFYKYKEVPREKLFQTLNSKNKEKILKIFVRDYSGLTERIEQSSKGKSILILTEPLCSLDVRKQIFQDLIDKYSKEGTVFLKPHPRDELDYGTVFPEVLSFEKYMPLEVLKLLDNVHFMKVISVYTQLGAVDYADEKVYLGHDFMDKYENPSVHRKTS